MKKCLFLVLFMISANCFSQQVDTVNLKPLFGDYIGAFSVYDINTGKLLQYNTEQCKKRFSPCSTFKVPSSLIGLESGLLADTSSIIPYDSIRHPKDSFKMATYPFNQWFQDLSLKQALKYSCVWYYQELARRVGEERMKKYVDLMNYGNKDISAGIDHFWLCGSIEISINEQIEFLKKLYTKKLDGFSDKNMEAVKQIMIYEETPEYKLYGKTGGCDCWDDKTIGWYVGFVETSSGPQIFAMNVIVHDYDQFKNNYRIELTKRILKELGIIKLP